MPHHSLFAIIILLAVGSAGTAAPWAILPKDVVYDPAIPTPQSYLGFAALGFALGIPSCLLWKEGDAASDAAIASVANCQPSGWSETD